MNNNELEQSEREYQNHIISLFDNKDLLGYNYLGNWQYGEHKSVNQFGNANAPIYEPELKAFLKSVNENGKPKYTDYQIDKAIAKLKSEIKLSTSKNIVFKAKNNQVYKILIGGLTAKTSEDGQESRVKFFDFNNPQANRFAVAEEVSYIDPITTYNRRPDIVIYVNGIALAVVELKKSIVTIQQGIVQHNSNQKSSIPSFFTTVQFCVVSNKDAFKYSTIQTPEDFWCPWKKDTNNIYDKYTNDESYCEFFKKDTFMFLFRWGVLSDGGRKKVMRPHQYHALKAAIPRLNEKSSGVIWHSQGSGKSLTMVWLASYIKENYDDAKIVVITDRTELDCQLSKDFCEAGHEIHQASSQLDLLSALQNPRVWLVSSLIHKFGLRSGSDDGTELKIPLDKYIEKLKEAIRKEYPNGFKLSSKNVFVFIDECHRTEGGRLHEGMREILGKDVMLIGFTGTPLLLVDKHPYEEPRFNNKFKALAKTSEYRIGPFIHKYLHKQAVADGVILDLRYTARDVNKKIDEEERDDLQKEFEQKTQGLTKEQTDLIEQHWATMKKVFTSKEPIERIANSILYDMETNPLLKQDWCNAMLIADSIYSAYRYYDYFQHISTNTILRNRCAVVTSYEPSQSGIRNANDGDDKDNETEFKYQMALKSYEEASSETEIHNAEQYESWAKKVFVERPYFMKLIIVVDKLLTGFDAPCATVLYIDKEMQNHTLFQAICRVNRLGENLTKEDGEEIVSKKEYGLIVDFRHLFDEVESAIKTFNLTGKSLSGYESEDVEGLLNDFVVKGKKQLVSAQESFDSIKSQEWQGLTHDEIVELYTNKNSEEDIAKRKIIYQILSRVFSSYSNLADYMGTAGYSSAESEKFLQAAKEAKELKTRIMLASGDFFNPKLYDKDMRFLLDQYIHAGKAKDLIDEETVAEFSFLDLLDDDESETEDIAQKIIQNTDSKKAAAEIVAGKARAVINTGKDAGNSEQLTQTFTQKLETILQIIKDGTADFKQQVTEVLDLIRKIKYGGEDIPKEIRKKKFTRVLWMNRKEWGASVDNAEAEKQIAEIRRIVEEDAGPSFNDTDEPDYNDFIETLSDAFPHLNKEQIQLIFRLIANNY